MICRVCEEIDTGEPVPRCACDKPFKPTKNAIDKAIKELEDEKNNN